MRHDNARAQLSPGSTAKCEPAQIDQRDGFTAVREGTRDRCRGMRNLFGRHQWQYRGNLVCLYGVPVVI
jgi:hypothetical protein